MLFSFGNRVLGLAGLLCIPGHRICLVSCSNSFSKCWLVMRSASTSSVLARTVSNAPPGGRLSTSSDWFASLEDWRCSCLCSKLIPSVAKRSTLFVKELSFP